MRGSIRATLGERLLLKPIRRKTRAHNFVFNITLIFVIIGRC